MNLPYGNDPRQVFDVHALIAATRPLPVMVFVHGGGFVKGDKEQGGGLFANVMHKFSRAGYLSINVEYPLAPQVAWPSGAEDVSDAVRCGACQRRRARRRPRAHFPVRPVGRLRPLRQRCVGPAPAHHRPRPGPGRTHPDQPTRARRSASRKHQRRWRRRLLRRRSQAVRRSRTAAARPARYTPHLRGFGAIRKPTDRRLRTGTQPPPGSDPRRPGWAHAPCVATARPQPLQPDGAVQHSTQPPWATKYGNGAKESSAASMQRSDRLQKADA